MNINDDIASKKQILRIASALALTLALTAQVRANSGDIQRYVASKEHRFTQTSVAPSTEDPATPWRFNGEIQATFGTSAGTSSVQSPTVTLPNASNIPFPYDTSSNLWRIRQTFTSKPSLDAAFPNGSYIFSMPTVTAPATTFNASLGITGDTYANIPSLTNTSWSGGNLLLDPAQGFTFMWNSFTGQRPGAFISLSISGMPDQELSASATSFFLPANSLPPGQLIKARLNFNNPTTTDTTSVPGVTGLAGYGTSDRFTIQTGPPVIISPLFAAGTVGQPFTYQAEAAGATSVAVTNLPAGLSFNPSLQAIVGNPTAAGTFQVGLSATNSQGTTNATLTITVQPAPSSGPAIIGGTAATGRTGLPFTFHVVTTGGTPATRITATGLPNGLNIDPVTGVISGTPADDGSSAVSLTVMDGNFTTTSTLQLTFTSDPVLPVIISPDRAALSPGEAFSYTIVAPSSANPSDPTMFTKIGPLPAGLTFNAATGTISGTYIGPLAPELAGGALLGSIQLFATNSHGTSTFQLLFRAAPSGAVNIATRLQVRTGENVLIGGFIISGTAPKVVIIRAIGPSLSAFGISGALQDPILELHNGSNVLINDDWRTGNPNQEQIIRDTGIPPSDDRESAIVLGLDPGSYTAIVRGKNDTTGIALVEVYDLGTASLDASGNARLADISTRGFVDTGNNVMIGGFQIRRQATRVVVRAIGPSLSAFGISGALPDPTLALKDANGATLISNDDWQQGQPAEIQQAGLAPTDTRESALIATLAPGDYTAIISGKGGATGVALAEVYALQ